MLKTMQKELTIGAINNPGAFKAAQTHLRNNVAAINDYAMQSVRARAATQVFTEALIKQDVGLVKAVKTRKMFNAVLKEQYALQKMTAIQYSRDAGGNLKADVIVPRGVNENVDKLSNSLRYNAKELFAQRAAMRASAVGTSAATKASTMYNEALTVMKMRVGLAAQYLDSVAHKMINWGKNTQWAGRQLTVGLSVPLAAFAALAGKAAYDVNAQLTRIIKVYDFASKGAARASEQQNLINMSMQMGTEVAKKYGASLTDTLDVEAQLAATGLRGEQLVQSTANVQRAAILGEMDKQDTIRATIALQSILHHSTSQLSDDFNYMNSVENATNLSMQDIVTAIPRALGPIHQLGGSLQDMVTLTAAMKQAGIDAGQGANTLKFSVSRLINPTKAAVDMLQGFNINIKDIVQKNGGNFIKILFKLSELMSGLSPLAKQQIIAQLFSARQQSAMLAVINGLGQVHDKTTQVGRAFQVAQQNTTQWAMVANGEMKQIQESASGKFRIAVASIKAQFANLGEPFLQFATVVVKVFTGIIAAINKMPHGLKVMAIGLAVITAAAGPLIMLTGLMGNMVGQGLNLAHVIMNLGTSFKAQTTEEFASKMLAEQHSYVWKNQANSARALGGAIQKLTTEFQTLAATQMEATMSTKIPGFTGMGTLPPIPPNSINSPVKRIGTIGPAAPPVYADPNSTRTGFAAGYSKVGRGLPFISRAEVTAAQAYERQLSMGESYSAGIMANTAKTESSWKTIGGRVRGLAVGAGLMGMMLGPSHGIVANLTQAVFLAGVLGPTIVSGLRNAKILSFLGSIGSRILSFAAPLIGMLKTKLLPLAEKLGGSIAGLVPEFALAAAAAAGFWYIWHRHAMKAINDQKNINDSAQNWSDILGYVYQDYKKIDRVQQARSGNTQDALIQLAAALGKANPALQTYLQNLGQEKDMQDAVNAATYEGIKAKEHGASTSQATETVKVALTLAGYRGADLQKAITEALSQVKFGDDQSVVDAESKQFGILWQKIAAGAVPDVKTAGEGLAKEFANAMSGKSPQQKKQMFDNLAASMKAAEDQFKTRMNISSSQSLPDALHNATLAQGLHNGARAAQIKNFIASEQALVKSIAIANGYTGKQLDQFNNLFDLTKTLSVPTLTLAQAQKQFGDVVNASNDKWLKMNATTKLATLNHYRLAAGLSKAKTLEQGFGDAVGSTNSKLNSGSSASKKYADSISQLSDTMKSAYQGAIQASVGVADNFWSEATQAQTDALQNQQTAQDNAYSRQERNLSHHFNRMRKNIREEYGSRIKALNGEIKAENKAEARRQAIFQAEQERLQRQADMANNSIDFNVALNSGNLDEAAKIFSDMQSQQDQNAIQDSQKKDQSASEKRVARLNAEVKAVEKLRDAKLKAIDKEEAADKKALERQKKRYDDEVAARETSLQRELDMKKTYLDLEIQAITASVPRTKAEYNKQISQIEAAYKSYGVDLQSYGGQWGTFVGKALSSNVKAASNGLASDINWQHIAFKVADQFAQGAFGLTIKQFDHWITTGNKPKGGLHPKNVKGRDFTPSHDYAPGTHARAPGSHTGGVVGQTGPRNLAGRSPSQGLFPDEMMLRAQKGEYVINKATHKALGTGFFDNLNAVGRHAGGAVGPAGLGMGMGVGMLIGTIGAVIQAAGKAQMGEATSTGFGSTFQNISDGMAGIPGSIPTGRVSGTVAGWLKKAMALTNTPSNWLGPLELIVQNESGGNPHSYNPTPVPNGIYGLEHAEGLMQTLPSTFEAHRLHRLPDNIWNPVANAAAGIRYIDGRYHSVFNVPGVKSIANGGGYLPYDNGGFLPPGMSGVFNGTKKPEVVFTAQQWSTLNGIVSAGAANSSPAPGGDTYNITFDFRDAIIKEDVDIEKAVDKALAKRGGKMGRSRKIGDMN